MATKVRLGKNAKSYYNAGTYMSPSWTLFSDNISNATLSRSKGEGDASRRGSGGDKSVVAGQKERMFEFTLIRRDGDGFYQILSDSYETDSVIDVLILDGPYNVTGSSGDRFDAMCFKLDRNEQLSDPITYAVTLKPTDSDNVPVRFTAP